MTARSSGVKKTTAAKEKLIVVHRCSQKQAITHLLESNNKLSVIITGNGHPEEGLCRQVAIVAERQGGVIRSLEQINEQLKGVNENHNVLLGEITRVASEVAGMEKQDERDLRAVELAEKKRQDSWQRIIWIVMAVVALVGIFINNIHTTRNSKKIDNMGTPVIVNKQGMPTALPNGDQLKYYPKDYVSDTTKLKKTNKK